MASPAVHRSRGERGAALIIAVGVLTVLLVIGATFFRISQTELQVASNVTDQVRMDLMAEGATSVAVAHLRQDRIEHPTVTSLDHPWSSYFNGAWAAGKPWMWQGASAFLIANNLDDNINGETDEDAELYIDPSGDVFDNDGDGAIDEANEGRDFIAKVVPIIRLRPDGTVPPLVPADADDIPDPPDYRFPRDAAKAVDLTRPLPTNLGVQLYFPRVEPVAGPVQMPALAANIVRYSLADYGDAYDGVVDGEFNAALAADKNGDGLVDADDYPFVVARNRAGGDFGVSPIYNDGDANVLNDAARLVEEQIALWADIDNDGDDLNDSVWLPVSSIRVLDNDNLDNDLDGIVDEPGELGIFLYNAARDGLDNDGNGTIDDEDLPLVDRNGDGVADALDAFRIMFTTHFRSFIDRVGVDDDADNAALIVDGIDNDNDGFTDEANEGVDEPFEGTLTTIALTIAEWQQIAPDRPNIEPGTPHFVAVAPPGVRPDSETDVDVLDNDFTLFANDRSNMARYVNAVAYDSLDQLDGADDDVLHVNLEIFAEPVSEITGRMAILVSDVATKANVNAAGAHVYTRDASVFPTTAEFDVLQAATRVARSFNDGLRVSEYETQILPDIGPANARWMWQYRTGAPNGDFVWDPGNLVQPDYRATWVGNYFADVSTPGYGYVDDNGDALWLSLNGLDDSGNGFADDGVTLHDYGAGAVFAEFLEGIDDPLEWQRFRPLRNTLAETDGAANTGIGDPDLIDGVLDTEVEDFVGELADTYFKTHEQTKEIISLGGVGGAINNGFDVGRFRRIEPFITVHSTDRNIRFDQARDQNAFWEPRQRIVSGVRLDVNVVEADRIRNELVDDFGYLPVNPEQIGTAVVFDADAIRYALGLKRGDVTVTAFGENAFLLGQTIPTNGLDDDGDADIDEPDDTGFDEQLTLRADPRLRAAQLAANTNDFRDVDRVRTEISTFFDDDWWNVTETATIARQIEYVSTGVEAIRINELMVRPVRRVEAEMQLGVAARDPNAFSDALFGLGVNDDFFDIYDDVQIPLAPGNLYLGRQMADEIEDRASPQHPEGTVTDRWELADDTLMGIYAAWSTDVAELVNPDFVDITTTPAEPETYPNIIQFTFEASPELPAGRYYLTVNSVLPAGPADSDPTNDALYTTNGDQTTLRATATDLNEIQFATKYVAQTEFDNLAPFDMPSGVQVTMGTTDIVRDVYDAVRADTNFHQDQIWQRPIVGYRDPGVIASGLSGWMFLPSNLAQVLDPTEVTTEVAATSVYGYFQDSAYTVEIPEFDAVDRPRLCVAFKHDPDVAPVPVIAVNFFDFSQEPDHEYIELINIDPVNDVDIGGWAVTVDGETVSGAGDRRKIMTIPQGTTIAAGGSLLLTPNKFDQFINDPTEIDLLRTNGIGMINELGTNFAGVTVPPIGDGQGIAGDGLLGDIFSGFDAGDDLVAPFVDYVDADGDGVIDGGPRPDDTIDSDNDDGDNDPNTGDFTNVGDRIIELEIPALATVVDVQRLARIVLGGGILPNYPERDAIDNDLDIATLQMDLVDNNLNGDVDDVGEVEGIDENFRAFYLGGVDLTGNGDEDGDGNNDNPVEGSLPGSFIHDGAGHAYRFDPDGTLETIIPDARNYVGVAEDSPAFRAFIERRWYPGDNVIVTLYEDGGTAGGHEGLSRIVDRVTYNELDVINRSIDDLINVTLNANLELDSDYPTLWPHDTMGIDFYSALERKHPLSNGDRFGTQNRWQATDGNYDDWADRTSRFERAVSFGFEEVIVNARATDPPSAPLFDHAYSGSPLRANLSHRLAENLTQQFGDNDISDDTAGNGTDETPRQWAFNRVDVVGDRSRPALRAPSQLVRAPHILRKSAITSRAQGAVIDVIVDIDSVNQSWDEDGAAPADDIRQDRSYQQVLIGQTFPETTDADRLSPVMTGGVDDPEVPLIANDLAALTATLTAHTSITLTAGQAAVFPMWPLPLDTDLTDAGVATPEAQDAAGVPVSHQWNAAGVPALGLQPPVGWSPVHLWQFAGDGATPVQQMYNPIDADAMQFAGRFLMETPPSIVVDTPRWPLDGRATMYVSGNLGALTPGNPADDFDPASNHVDQSGAEALFVWTGDDGLENGEYDVYVMLNERIGGLNTAHLQSGDALLLDDDVTTPGVTDFGLRFMQTVLAQQQSETSRASVLPEDVVIDIDLFTDRNGDRRVWNTAKGNDETLTPWIPKPGTLSDGLDDGVATTPFEPDFVPENFGMQAGASPGPDGIYHYPLVVTVENNYLALFLRNRTPTGSMVAFSRIILAPRDRVPGKLNINTVMTRNAEQPGGDAYFNTLTGVPGINRNYDLAADVLAGQPGVGDPGDAAPPLDTEYVPGSIATVDPAPFNDIAAEANVALLGRASKIAIGRPERVDGRYYDFAIDGARPTPGLNAFTEVDIQEPGVADDEEPIFSSETDATLFEEQFDETMERYTRTENLITTRSDVFEILVTVQTGAVSDRNGDGVFNYRDDFEFSITGERQMRTVYER